MTEPKPIPVNLPVAPPEHQGSSRDFDIFSHARSVVRSALREAGFEEIGCGFGARDGTFGEADIGLKWQGEPVEVRIFLPEPK